MHARFPSVEQRRLHAQAPPPPEIELDFVHQLQNPRKVHHQRHSSSHGSRPPSIQESIGGGGPRTPKSPSSPSFLGFGWFFPLKDFFPQIFSLINNAIFKNLHEQIWFS